MNRSISFFLIITIVFSSFISQIAFGAPINSNVALPVRKGGLIFRSQMRWIKASDDPTSQRRERDVIVIPNVLLYGATRDLALFAVFPYIFRTLKFPDPETGNRINQKDNGIGDLSLIARYTVYAKDYPSGTFRLAPLFGIKIPTGDDDLRPITTDSFDLQFGVVSTVTWDFGRHELDADAVYRVNTEADNFDKGDSLTYDLSYQLRVFPWNLPERGVPNFINLVAEANGFFAKRNSVNGSTVGNSGGNIIFLSPGLQYAARRYIIESSIQLPVIQDLNGNQIEADFVWTIGFRINIL
ncbi:MAG: transporter [Thermodesulfobacteriota bacterium]